MFTRLGWWSQIIFLWSEEYAQDVDRKLYQCPGTQPWHYSLEQGRSSEASPGVWGFRPEKDAQTMAVTSLYGLIFLLGNCFPQFLLLSGFAGTIVWTFFPGGKSPNSPRRAYPKVLCRSSYYVLVMLQGHLQVKIKVSFFPGGKRPIPPRLWWII